MTQIKSLRKRSSFWHRVSYVVAALVIISAAASAQPHGIHLSWNTTARGKISSTMGITWLSNNSSPAKVVYGTDSIKLNKSVSVGPRYSDSLQLYVMKASLKNLRPATYYYYKVGSETGGWSDIYRFKTAPVAGSTVPINIGVWSDTQNNNGNFNFEQSDAIVKKLANNPIDFTLHTGDIVENGSVQESWKGFFKISQPLNAKFPFMSVTGNHDVVNDTTSNFQRPFPVFYDLFNLPNDQLNYSYDYGNTHFIAINSGFAQGAEKVGKVLFKKDSREYQWLEKDLTIARKNTEIKWIILYCHYPVYSYGFSHIPTWQQQIKPIIDKFNVDLVISGHRHVYERHAPIRGDKVYTMVDKNTYTKPKGTIYITNGSCGGSLQGTGGYNLPSMIFTPNE
jgi:predicted MPP superfamily phosphohydrolase